MLSLATLPATALRFLNPNKTIPTITQLGCDEQIISDEKKEKVIRNLRIPSPANGSEKHVRLYKRIRENGSVSKRETMKVTCCF